MQSKENRTPEIRKYFTFSDDIDVKEEFSAYLRVKLTEVTDPYFTYRMFVESWWDKTGVCYVYYENFKVDPERELLKIMNYLNVNIDEQRLAHAIEYNTFENVTFRKYGKARKPCDEDGIKFQRKGVSGDWLNYFTRSACELIDDFMGDIIIRLGYEQSNDWVYMYQDKQRI